MARPSAPKAPGLPVGARAWVRQLFAGITDDPKLKRLLTEIYRVGYAHGRWDGHTQGHRAIPSAGGAAMRRKSIPKLIAILVVHDLVAEQIGKVSHKQLADILNRSGVAVSPDDGQIKRALRARAWLSKLTAADL